MKRRGAFSGGAPGLVRGLTFAVAAFAVAPGAAAGQTTEEVLVQRRLEYRSALADYQSAQAAFSVVERRFSAALAALDRARRSGDEEELAQAFAAAQERSLPVRDRRTRVAEAANRLEAARAALIEVLTIRLTELLTEMAEAGSPQEEAELDALWRDLNAELEQLETESEDPFRLNPTVLPEVTFDLRDTPEVREQKARLLERTAAMADSAVQTIQRQIDGLEERLRQERNRRDFLARTGRFGDTPPVGPTRPPGGTQVQVADSTGAPVRPQSLEERIQELRTVQQQIATYRDDLLIRARLFRRPPGGAVT